MSHGLCGFGITPSASARLQVSDWPVATPLLVIATLALVVVTRQQFRITQRAWITVKAVAFTDYDVAEKQPRIYISFQNTGPTPDACNDVDLYLQTDKTSFQWCRVSVCCHRQAGGDCESEWRDGRVHLGLQRTESWRYTTAPLCAHSTGRRSDQNQQSVSVHLRRYALYRHFRPRARNNVVLVRSEPTERTRRATGERLERGALAQAYRRRGKPVGLMRRLAYVFPGPCPRVIDVVARTDWVLRPLFARASERIER